ncbi:Antibiotic biosynthesis monooxygenase [Magnetococcus marinus MC-1]|uniref:Antibiotic biosynthesis monooxygenase n=1 Tax=Magnetococcus marinus (strain ATCC BAA-1437 / JCM 17883 / MC-1) TaxID=156889 RepID=A0LA75_MAGMM|nr:antibiotic biosynthesis monooxygenase [Magnetococcus marinus]ABK44868.1 Antibiotic biosynthesis monooxygenase [Magnetococcus marinus MC-1]
MIVVMNRIPVHKEHHADFEERFRNRAGLVDRSPGFIRNVILRPAEESSEYHVVMTFWESQAHFMAWTKSDAFREAHKNAGNQPEIYKGPNVFEMYEAVSETVAAKD